MKIRRMIVAVLAFMVAFTNPFGSISAAAVEIKEPLIEEQSIKEQSEEEKLVEETVSDNTVSQNDIELYAQTVCEEQIENTMAAKAEPQQLAGQEDTDEEESQVPKQVDLDGVNITNISMATYKSVKLTWTPIKDATAYEIYRSLKKTSKYVLVKTVNAPTFSFVDKTKSLVAGKKYYYKVRAIYTDGVDVQYGQDSAPKVILYSVPAVSFSSAKPAAGGTLQLKWKKVKGADGYEIRRSATENGKYKLVKKINSSLAQKCTLSATECDGSFFYKIRAYRIVKGKKVYGEYSEARKAEMTNLASDKETYQQKCKRVFGKPYYMRYATQAQALKNMTTITVKVWDLDAKGNKVTKQKMIIVHKNLALTLEKIFDEIYKGKEKFPIKAVGGFSWRGDGSTSEHNQGTAIDINPNENCMVEGNGTISSGSYWKPGTDPYSIPADGEVVKIFKKYGFRWGGLGWSSGRKDYMHFSYFGT